MNLTAFVDIAIGLTLMYMCASLLVTSINEFIAHFLTLRGKQLVESLEQVITHEPTRSALAKVPGIAPLFGGKGRKPSFVDPAVFANALVGAISTAQAGASTITDIVASLNDLPDSPMKMQLLTLARSAKGGINGFVQDVGTWIDKTLTVLGESYKAKLARISFMAGLGVAMLFNLDTLTVAPHLYRDSAARAAMAAAGAQIVDKFTPEEFKSCVTSKPPADESTDAASTGATKDDGCGAIRELGWAVTKSKDGALGSLPIGWDRKVADEFRSPWVVFTHILGWILTAGAISMGAPFWFDLLSKLVNLRHGMNKPEESTS